MASFLRHVLRVLQQAELIIEVIDARMPEETRNKVIEKKIEKLGKKIIFAINKCDLISQKEAEILKKKYNPCVFVSATQRLGTTMLKKKILELSKGQKVIVGVVGFPNVGKSSLINALAGRSKARTSSVSGYTKGLQKVKVSEKIMLIDTPGTFTQLEHEGLYGKTGAVSAEKIKNPEEAALFLIKDYTLKFKKYYSVNGDDPDEILENIALKLNKIKKGGVPDTDSASRKILQDWQRGKIK